MSQDDHPSPAPFQASFSATIPHAQTESIDSIGTTLLGQITMLQAVGRFLSIDHQALYESEQIEGWLKLVLYTEALYQQLHATVTTAAIFVGQRLSPSLRVSGLSKLMQRADAEDHPVGQELRRRRDDINLLRWMLRARNQAIQHRAEAGYLANRGVVLPDGFALLHSGAPLGPQMLRRANDLFVGLHRRHGNADQTRIESREVVTYLDLLSHELRELAPADYASARRVVGEAGAFDIVVSSAVIRNADAALASLIEIAPLAPQPAAAPDEGP